ncbi:MAG: hypothetical protein KKD55_02945 [Candidatus Omnitrophica bacterium]|nr:hypothetical protein [Candidatus Omnitrophota bacterium]MBU1367571.1 hypothetical protein [Candidatus Omnitrophota bacterium]MBU1523214.1 hypothetical protein [Candidatus Omnitrophota bacterium]
MEEERKISEIEKSVKTLNESISKKAATIKKHTTIVLVGGLIILVTVVGYLSYLHNVISRAFTPEDITSLASFLITTKIDEVSKEVEKQLVSSAPAITQGLIEQGFNLLPEMRLAAEEKLDAIVDLSLSQVKDRFAEAFQKVIMENEDAVKAIPQLLDEGKIYLLAEDLAEDIERGVLPPNFIPQLTQRLIKVDTELKKLLGPERKLNEEQKLEKKSLQLWLQIVDKKAKE